MAVIKAFRGIRPRVDLVSRVASKPYDVLNSAEARVEVEGNPHSFLHVVKPEVDLPEDIDVHSDPVYQKGRENFDRMVADGVMVQDGSNCLYVYQQVMDGRVQNGLVACSWVEDYFNDVIKKHEFTRPVKEQDRINHMKALSAHPGPVFITYPDVEAIDAIVDQVIAASGPVYDFKGPGGVEHRLWVIDNGDLVEQLELLFAEHVPATYIADGHHRAASSAKVGKALADQNPDHHGGEEYNYFLSVLFPASHLMIIDYNRVVKDLNGLSVADFLARVGEKFEVSSLGEGAAAYRPSGLHDFGMYLDKQWYRMVARAGTYNDLDPIGVLDVTILQDNLLAPVLGIADPRTDDRVDFVGGIRGLGELEKRVDSGDMRVAFSLFPVTIQQLIDISDSGNVMPPKSTWFEPKLMSGVVVHGF